MRTRIFFIFLTLIGFAITSINTSSQVKASDGCTAFSGNGINNWYPFAYRKDDGQLTGIVVDGTHEALKRIGLTLNIDSDKPWKRILYDLEHGNVDMVLGAYWNSERAEKYHYSEELGTDELRVFVKDGNQFSFSSPQDLIGRSGMRLLGGSLGDDFDTFAKNHLDFIEVPKSDSMVVMLQNNRADYGILGYIEGLQHAYALNLEKTIIPLAVPVLSNSMHVMINKNAECASRVDDMNKAIEEMRADGTLQKIIDDHLGLIKQ
ncbi:ABC transporter substrate-binding protein [Kiloniella sp. EL199]|uniref:substrate-binding periplasmic protein n=1 Tax=Kiloniella sp. EL199 TaxID=2107581 RepID=UPI000EA3A256|nr:transporter substrate-binding domain-containing protein [Kiloniella sp. EL199]